MLNKKGSWGFEEIGKLLLALVILILLLLIILLFKDNLISVGKQIKDFVRFI